MYTCPAENSRSRTSERNAKKKTDVAFKEKKRRRERGENIMVMMDDDSSR